MCRRRAEIRSPRRRAAAPSRRGGHRSDRRASLVARVAARRRTRTVGGAATDADARRCQIGGKVGWAPGTINAVDELNPSDPTEVLPYVVKVDPPVGRLIIVPFDANAGPPRGYAFEMQFLSSRRLVSTE